MSSRDTINFQPLLISLLDHLQHQLQPIMFALRRIIARPMLRVATRQIHVTPRRFASADQPPNMQQLESMMNDPHIRETFEKLSRHPPAIEAMQKMGDIIKS